MFGIFKDKRMQYLLLSNIFSSVGAGITMVGVPWYLVTREGGDQIWGYSTLGVTILLFLISPSIGVWVDRMSRKKVMLFSEVFGFLTLGIFAAWGWIAGEYQTWHLVAVHLAGSFYYSLHFPAQFAFTQEIFAREQYQSLNSAMEIQSQTASMVAAGLASMMVGKVDLALILTLDALTYVIGFWMIAMIPYQEAAERKNRPQTSFLQSIQEGFSYLKERPMLGLFFICAFMPFLIVMVGNYLFPIYITKVLNGAAYVLGVADLMYAVGAVAAGLTLPLLMRRFGSYRAVLITASVFTVGTLVTAWVHVIAVLFCVKMLLGWGNAGVRVARNTVMMERVPNQLSGRVNSFFNAFGMAVRVTLIGLFTQIIVHTGADGAFAICGFLLIGAVGGILLSRGEFRSTSEPQPLTKNSSM